MARRVLFSLGHKWLQSTSLVRLSTTHVLPAYSYSLLIRPSSHSLIGNAGVKVVTVRKFEGSDDSKNKNPAEANRPVSTSATATQASSGGGETTPTASMIESVVGKVGDFNDGEMKEVEIGDKKALLVKESGQFYAVSNKCTHYGAPLTKGAYCKGVVRCPWHGACFNVKTGDIEDFPGLDSLQKFEVEVRGEDVVVRADPASLENNKRVKAMVRKAADNKKTVVLVGGGPSTLVCAETLRQEGFTGRVVLVSQENCLPYDRIKLSKAMSIKPEEIALRKADFYENNGIELMLGQQVESVSTSDKKLNLGSGESLGYDTLVLGTGGQPRRLPIPGIELGNVYMLRTPADANAIAENAVGKNVVIVGSSFIGLEVATFMVNKAASVNVIGRSSEPCGHVFGPQIGQWFRKLHESKGVKFHFETSVKEFRGEDGKVTEAVLANGETLPADVCVMGVGVVPATQFLQDSGVDLTSRGFVTVNKKMQTNVSDVYAAGDIVEFPLFTAGDQQANVQHWQMAHMHGRIAGLNIAGKPTDVHSVPYFWTVQYGKSIRYTGYGPGYDDVVLHGDVDEGKFLAYYTKADQVVAVASLGWDPVVSQAAQLLNQGGSISKAEITSEPSSWVSRLCQ
ncbi:apoptosis-inducing factor 3 isoform X1 [Aplysia californica]|uniref:Apoptosis-inducing factor 3 isoform X1 n=2 Tax=Aplysia californica TaxID=6500 RepID=A0ABM1VRK2_APLCA|nr:apoptosis-inducing factor 3 isoform X1 [Aplysia californica]